MERPSYYAILPSIVRYDNDLKPNEKLLYAEISALMDVRGYCWASNKYFAELFDVTPETVSRWVSHLTSKSYLQSKIVYAEDGKTILERRLHVLLPVADDDDPIDKKINRGIDEKIKTPIDEKIKTPIDKKVKEINTRVNITSINNITGTASEKKQKKFVKPTVEEIKAYCQERKNDIDAEYFYDHYESQGWKVGKNPMKDWKATIRNWERNGYSNGYSYGKRGSDPFDVRYQQWDESDPTVH